MVKIQSEFYFAIQFPLAAEVQELLSWEIYSP